MRLHFSPEGLTNKNKVIFRRYFIVLVRVPKGKCSHFFVQSVFAINYYIGMVYITNRFATAFYGSRGSFSDYVNRP